MKFYLAFKKLMDEEGKFFGIENLPLVFDQEELDIQEAETMNEFLVIELHEANDFKAKTTSSLSIN